MSPDAVDGSSSSSSSSAAVVAAATGLKSSSCSSSHSVQSTYSRSIADLREAGKIISLCQSFSNLFSLIGVFLIPSSRLEEDVHLNADDINIAPKPSLNQ